MSKKSEIGNEVANSMNELLGSDSFTRIFHNVKTASVKEAEVNTEAVSDYKAFEQFVSLAKKKDKEEEVEKEDKKEDKDSGKKDDKKKEEKDSNKDDKKGKKKGKKPFPFWLKKKKASDNDKEYALAIKYMVQTLTRTSAALDNMGLEKSSIATMVALDHIIEEAAQEKFAHCDHEDYDLDENDVRGMDLLLGLDDPEAQEGFKDEELDDPHSSAALEKILMQNPELADELSSGLKDKFDVENQLKKRVKSRLENVVDTKGGESDIEELAAHKLPPLDNPASKFEPVNEYMKEQQDKERGGNKTERVPLPDDENWGGEDVRLDELNVDDPEVVKAYKELDAWVKSAEEKTVDGDDLDSLLETYIEG